MIEKIVRASVNVHRPPAGFLAAWMASGWCYWGAIRFAIWFATLRNRAQSETLGGRINIVDFALLHFGAACCGVLRMD